MALKVSVVTFCVHLRHRQVASADPRALCHPDRIYQLQAAMYSTISLFSDGLEGAGLQHRHTDECQHPSRAENIIFCQLCTKLRAVLINYISWFYNLSSN